MNDLIEKFKLDKALLGSLAKEILDTGIKSGDLGTALRAYQTVEDTLPSDRYMPCQSVYPHFYEYIRGQDFQRHETRGYLDVFEDEVWFFTEASEDEKEEIMTGAVEKGEWNPYQYQHILWEIVKGGKKSFTWDW
ncbi:hypothetical protein PQC38_gp075 [Aeromonas phage BUCT695]|uniref:hypothetical protein n=1 Tax=Aeromonas phage BUCT695 TaxID=2908630 RepID=UPI0023295D5F|nr:hypothetical protein PQC38_gp075 [Aeromonas phage BUCT695]UIW10551.1 hypothetical protein [Aeromonas phage BUCT695]